jgi:hypothetical protein
MSQENPTPEKTKEITKRLLLGGLLIVLVGVVYFQFSSGSDKSNSSSAAASAPKTIPSPTPQRQTSGTPAPIISQPLDLASMQPGSHSGGGTGRNIFVYPTPTPTPPPTPAPPIPTPTPWPIPVQSINPGGVIARTADFTLTVFGDKMPQDAQGFINGRAYPTTFVSATQVRINVPAEAIRMPGSLSVTVRSKSEVKLESNPTMLNVAAPPEPPYKYIGLVTLKNAPVALLSLQGQSDDDSGFRVKKGDVIGGRWKIINITPQKVEIEDTNIKVSHVLNYTVDNK